MSAAGKRPQSTHPLYQSKYHCYMTYFKIFSLGVWKTCLCSTRSCREARYLFCPFFFVFFLLKALPTCVIVWPLSACLLQSAVLCCSPHPLPLPLPPFPLLAASLRILQTGFPPPHIPPGLQAKSSSFRTGPPVLNLLLLLRQSLSSANSTSTLCLSPAMITLAWDRGAWCVFFFFFLVSHGIASVHFYFIVVMKFADIVAVDRWYS